MTQSTAIYPARKTAAPDWPFYLGLAILGSVYILLIVAMLLAAARYTTSANIFDAFRSPEIRYSIRLSLLSCTLTALFSLCVAVPTGYLLSRFNFPGKRIIDALLDIPIVLPPLVIGLCLLILFQTRIPFDGRRLNDIFPITYAVPSIILAQFTVACAFAIRTMLVSFEQISPRCEQVALTLGCSRSQAFWMVAVPESRRGILTAFTLSWARSLGEFGPILIFSGATRMKTEVLPTTVFLELTTGNIEAAVAVSLVMIVAALVVLAIARAFGMPTRSEVMP
jgi:molybdate transport system permease protein